VGITLIVTKSRDENFAETGQEIPLDLWLSVIERDPNLRLRAEPVTLTNPKTKQTISVDPLPGQSELCVGKQWVPFLGFRSGKLVMALAPPLEHKKSPVRHKVAQVARHFGAIITHDAGDEILRW
jgi:hypothetical protein